MKKNSRVLFILGFTLMAQLSFGQAGIGIGTTSPHKSAILHLAPPSKNKGLLVPRFPVSQMGAIPSPRADGLLFYDSAIAKFCYYDDGIWYTLNPMVQTIDQSGTVSATSHSGDINVSGKINATDYGLNTTGNGPVPKGGIIMWSGATNAIPTGWALCDGNNTTPDLRDRFIIGAGGGSGPGAVGGNSSIALSPGQLPSHSHTGTTSSPGAHAHSYTDDFSYIDRFWDAQFPGSYLENLEALGNHSGNGGTDNWSNTFAGRNKTTGAAGDHNHSFTTDATGSNQAINILPPYYALAYIMKL